MIRVKRVYAPPSEEDGERVLVDRLWPRGIRKAAAAIHEWKKDLAPSAELRRWFGHAPERWEEFRRLYAKELRRQPERLAEFRSRAREQPMTLLFAARDEDHNNAVVLRDVLLEDPTYSDSPARRHPPEPPK